VTFPIRRTGLRRFEGDLSRPRRRRSEMMKRAQQRPAELPPWYRLLPCLSIRKRRREKRTRRERMGGREPRGFSLAVAVASALL
jgi:hypothetical protein